MGASTTTRSRTVGRLPRHDVTHRPDVKRNELNEEQNALFDQRMHYWQGRTIQMPVYAE